MRLVEFFGKRFPGVQLDDYVYGALIANPGGREQYEQIMEFPPFLGDIDKGKKIWETPFRNGKTFADCFPRRRAQRSRELSLLRRAARKVVTFENAINACLRANGEAEFAYGDRQTMGVLTAYARTLSDGMRINIRIESPAAVAKYEAGRNLFFRRIGQLNAACAGCHVYNAGNDHAHGDHFSGSGSGDALAHLPRRRGADDIPGPLQALHGADARSALRFRQRGMEQPGVLSHVPEQRAAAEVFGLSQVGGPR